MTEEKQKIEGGILLPIPVEKPQTFRGKLIGLGPIRPFGKSHRCPVVIETGPERKVYIDFLGKVEKLQGKLSGLKIGQMVEIEAYERTWIDSEGQERIGYRGRTVKVIQEKTEEKPKEEKKEEKPEIQHLAEIVEEKIFLDQKLLAEAVNRISSAVLEIRNAIDLLKQAVEGKK